MRRYSIESRIRKHVKGYGFLSFEGKYKKQLMDTVLDSLKIASKKVVHKAGEFVVNQIEDTATKSNDDKVMKQEPAEEIIILSEKKRWNIKQIEKSIIKMEHYKISKLLNYSSLSKFVTRKWVKVNDLLSGQYSVKNIRFKISC